MALTVDTTLSGQFSNSYIDSDFVDDYWENHWDTLKAAQWAALTDDQKNYLLIQANRVIETVRCIEPVGLLDDYHLYYDRHSHLVLNLALDRIPIKFYYYQQLQFPRNLDRDVDTGVTFIPGAVKMAQAEQAVYLLNFDDSPQVNRLQGILEESVRVGHIYSSHKYTGEGSAFCPMAIEFLRPYFLKSSSQLRRA